MSTKTIRCCDECGAERKEANHWFCAIGDQTEPTFCSFENAEEEDSARPRMRFDYCGQSCVTTAFQRWLSTGDIVKTVPKLSTPLPEEEEEVGEL